MLFLDAIKTVATVISESTALLHESVRLISKSSVEYLTRYANCLSDARLLLLKICVVREWVNLQLHNLAKVPGTLRRETGQ